MTLDTQRIRAVVFDYGNTLIPFGRGEIAQLDAALHAGLAEHFTPPDPRMVAAIRDRNRMTPYQGDPPAYRENDLTEITERLIRELYDIEPAPEVVAELIDVRHRAFVNVLQTPDYVVPLLERLAGRYKLAVLSNYPGGASIREGLARGGLDAYLEAVVVSGDLGYCKPHPITFNTVANTIGLTPEALLYVGDNWLADVQGAKRAGWQMVLSQQWRPPEVFPPEPGHLEPDATIGHLTELETLLRDA
ncbi:MAG: HAD family hydrolase [Candidatus Hydrogenedentota bacterium]